MFAVLSLITIESRAQNMLSTHTSVKIFRKVGLGFQIDCFSVEQMVIALRTPTFAFEATPHSAFDLK